jgi:uncharacterized protein Smg (DUF494 family)
MMNLFSLIADQVQNKQDLFRDEGKIMDALITNGYRLHEADAALTLMQELSRETDAVIVREQGGPGAGMRAMNAEERRRFSLEAFGFLLKLAHLGVITEDQREDLIERALSLHRGKIDLSHVKALIALNVFADAREPEEFFSAELRRTGAAWN